LTEKKLEYHANDEAATARLGTALAEVVPDGTTVALYGTLGAGKTRLVQAIAEAAGIDRRDVISPTFVLIKEYRGRRTICHIDAFRIKDEDEFLELGPDEYFESDAVVLVEWADRVEAELPRERIEIRIEITGDGSRQFTVASAGNRYEKTIDRLATLLR